VPIHLPGGEGVLASMRRTAHIGPASRRAIQRWRTVVASLFIFVFLFPIAGTLGRTSPGFILGVELDAVGANAPPLSYDESPHDDAVTARIPDNHGHPPDHGCLPCQILKYLAACLPQVFPVVRQAAVAPRVDLAIWRSQARRSTPVGLRPPSRGPPACAA
jgi:hypothetical protein